MCIIKVNVLAESYDRGVLVDYLLHGIGDSNLEMLLTRLKKRLKKRRLRYQWLTVTLVNKDMSQLLINLCAGSGLLLD